ncbi:MAG: YhdP family protein [Ideonella sp.]
MPLRWLKVLAWLMRVLLIGVVVLWSALLLIWLVLHWGILPHIDQWRGTIEQRASSALGIEVRIGDIQVRSSGWVPSIEMNQVMLFDRDKRPALVLPRVVAALAPQSLLALDLRFRQLFIEGARLEIRRNPAGRILVAGLDIDQPGGKGDDGAALRWFLKQSEFVIRGGSLRWIDEQRAAPPLELTDVLLVMRNGLRSHSMQFDATPPLGWGERFSLRGRFRQPLLDGEDLKHWTGTAFADLPRAEVRQLQQYVTLPFAVSEGDGAVRAWVDLTRGVATSATVDIALRTVKTQLGSRLQPLALEQVEGRVVVSRQDDRHLVEARQLGFRTGDGANWPRGDVKVAWRKPADGTTTDGELSAQQLDLGVMSQIAASLPIGEPVRKMLAQTRPQGIVRGLDMSFTGAPDDPRTYRMAGEIDALSLAARASTQRDGIGRPGLHNAGLSFKATEKGGDAQLRIHDGQMEFPGVFDEPVVPFSELGAQISWQIDDAPKQPALPKITVAVKSMQFGNADAQGKLKATWTTGPGEGTARNGRFPGRLQLEGELSRGDGARVARYLPRQINAELRNYVGYSVKNGAIRKADFRVNGDLWDFPYPESGRHAGEFRIAAQVEGLTFAYIPTWPARGDQPAFESTWPPMTQLNGELIFDRVSMEIRNATARIGNVRLDPVRARIANFAAASTLEIDGRGKGPASEMLKFVNTTPVGTWLGEVLKSATISGDADLRLTLSMPLGDTSKTSAKGSIDLAGNELRIQPETPSFSNARGRIDFSNRGFHISNASARLLGGEASFEGGTQSDGSVRFNGGGVASAEGLRRAVEPSALGRAARQMSGQATYKASLGFVRGHSEINVTSNLVGIAVDLPAPLRKPADAALPLRYQTALLPESAGPAVRERVRLELGTSLQAQYLLEYPAATDAAGLQAEPRVISGGIGVNEPAPTPQAGVAASLNLGTVNSDAWQAVLEKISEPSSGAGGNEAVGGYAPTSIALRAQQLEIGERRFNGLVAGLSNENGNWRANLDARQLSGYAEYRPARLGPGASAAGRVYARLSRLSLPKQEAEEVENLLDQQPANVPSLDIVVDEFELRGKHLGRVEIQATNRNEGSDAGRIREWRLTRLNMTNPDARLTASGSWGSGSNPEGPRHSEIDFKLDLVDSGDFLERLQIGRAIRNGKGQLAGRIGWQGSPFSIDFKSLHGQFKVAIEAGQFLNAEPGAARLLSVLSLQALPRRLALDFRDVFQKGFAFDSVTGDVGINQGVARTNNLLMRGTQAAVLMEGMADIERESQDIRVIVVPEINVGNAALAYAAINPAIGLGAFVAQLVLRKPLIQAGTREFHVSGSWEDPKVERVQRKLNEPLPDLDPEPLPSATGQVIQPVAPAPETTGQAVR